MHNFKRAMVALLFFLVTLPVTEMSLAQDLSEGGGDVEIGQNPGWSLSGLNDPGMSEDALAQLVVPLTVVELTELAAEWQRMARYRTEGIARSQVALIELNEPPTSEAIAQLEDDIRARDEVFARYLIVLAELEAKGGDATMIAELHAYRDAVLRDEVQLMDDSNWRNTITDWAQSDDGGRAFLQRGAIVVAAFLGLVVVARLIRAFARRSLSRISSLSKLLKTFLVGAIYWAVLVVGLVFVLALLGVNVTPLFAMIGGASFILAFAFQDTLGNLASGLMIMINRPFDEGDYVDIAGTSGTVRAVSIVATTVITPDNQIIVIPNKNVWGSVITNVTASDTRRVDMVFGIGYEDSIEDALRVMEDVVLAHPCVMSDPAPVIRVGELADSSVNFICRPWTRTEDYWTVYWDLTHQMKDALTQAGISIPYPQQDVHIHQKAAPLL